MSVYTIVINKEGSTSVDDINEARPYQKDAYNTFMKIKDDKGVVSVTINFNYPGGYKFIIKNFDSGLKGDYSSLCVLVNDKREERILSNEREVLKKYVEYGNRFISSSGGVPKKKSKKQKSKKKSKRKLRKH